MTWGGGCGGERKSQWSLAIVIKEVPKRRGLQRHRGQKRSSGCSLLPQLAPQKGPLAEAIGAAWSLIMKRLYNSDTVFVEHLRFLEFPASCEVMVRCGGGMRSFSPFRGGETEDLMKPTARCGARIQTS